MNNFFKTLAKWFKTSETSVNTGRKLKHIVFITILAVATVMMIVPKFKKSEETVTTEDPIESYDNVVEIVIGDDGAVIDTEDNGSETVGG